MSRAKIFCVASFGGHWRQLLKMTEELGGNILFISTNDSAIEHQTRVAVISDFNKNRPGPAVLSIFRLIALFTYHRPRMVITTGAAPGLIAVIIGKLFFCKTIWVDSIANSEQLSGSGQLARYFADEWLTQWEHLATPKGPSYVGRIL